MSLFLFTDGSVNPQLGVGFGASLSFNEPPENVEDLRNSIKIKRFENTSSTVLELQTLLWALSEISESEIVSYTDSQNILSLLSRRERLIQNGFVSRSGKLVRNHLLYKEFFESIEGRNIVFNQLSGHMPSMFRHGVNEIFALVDRASRNALRDYAKSHV